MRRRWRSSSGAMAMIRGLQSVPVAPCCVLVGYGGHGSSGRARTEPLQAPLHHFFPFVSLPKMEGA